MLKMGRLYFLWITPLVAALLCGAEARGQAAPVLSFASAERDASLGAVYRSAIENLLRINTVRVPHRGRDAYNQAGLLRRRPGTFFRAGGGYKQPWTRDASVNSWSGGSLLAPEVARNTLFSVVRRERNGKLIVQQDDQWWDQTIWIVAAWNHFLVTGDRAFLAHAYEAAEDTLDRERELHFNQTFGLFAGPAFLNDGIAGYPVPPATASEDQGSFVLRYAGADRAMVLSTNCIYAGAYGAAAAMAAELHKPSQAAAFSAQGAALAVQIRERFWLAVEGRFGYLLHADGTLDRSQEGSGSAFALLFGVATPEQSASVLRTVHEERFGLPDVWPAFARYSAEQPGRHNNILWPPIMALWAEAAAKAGEVTIFAREVERLAGLAAGDRDHFWEIYNGDTGLPSGGWQAGHLWFSEPNQTWSATAYLRMIYTGLFGLRFSVDGLRFEPTLPAGWGDVTLRGVRYRGTVLTIELHGAGRMVKSFRLDGRRMAEPTVSLRLKGRHTIVMEMGDAVL